MTRREFPSKVKVAAALRAGGRCEKCTARTGPGNIEYDHRIPDGIGGEPTLENCEVLCRACHGAKTAGEDIPRIAKTKRQRAGHINAKVKRPWHPTLRRKMSGEVVRREHR